MVYCKPAEQRTVEEHLAVLCPLSLSALEMYGLDEDSRAFLEDEGIHTIGDLRIWKPGELQKLFPRYASEWKGAERRVLTALGLLWQAVQSGAYERKVQELHEQWVEACRREVSAPTREPTSWVTGPKAHLFRSTP